MAQPERKIKEQIEVDENPIEEGSDLRIVLRLADSLAAALANSAAREELERLGAIEETRLEAETSQPIVVSDSKTQKPAA